MASTKLRTQAEDSPLAERFHATRALTEALAAPLSESDATIQSMEDASPAKWHLAHTTWFWETFLLRDHLPDYTLHDERWPFLFTDAGNMLEYASGFTDPNFSQWEFYAREMLVTLQIALWGTFLSLILSVPFGILSARNMVPWWILQPTRRLMDFFRAIHELVWAVLFVVAVGLGPFAGVMALFIHNTGIMAKLFSEAVESIDPRPVEGVLGHRPLL